ncbi:MAG: glycerol kinase GlpK [Bradymonadales bacterium]|nr:MAG: glycerol kinase GlpK [Bradymonadales bacterium]
MILGIDQGTTGTTAVLMTKKGQIKSKFTSAVTQHYPKAGWVEHDPNQIMKSLSHAISGALTKARARAEKIEVIGITNQRETVSLFEGRKALHRFIVWQDRRSSRDCDLIRSRFGDSILKKTGLPVDPYFSSSKIAWLIRELKLSKKRDLKFRTIDSFLLHQLTGEDVTEITNAHRTQLLGLESGKWEAELFDQFDIPQKFAPQIVPSEGAELSTKALSFLPKGIPIRAILGDQQAALFGQNAWKPSTGKITFGTGSFILVNTGDDSKISEHKLAATIALQWKNGKKVYALEGSSFICGAWIQWLRDELGLLSTSKDSEKLAKKVKDSLGVMVIPALTGLGAPFWKSEMRGQIVGLTRGTNRSHIARASLEALAFQNRALIDAIRKDAGDRAIEWRVDGGASQNNLLMQIQSDVLDEPLIRPKSFEATAVGVGLLAAFSIGLLSLKEIESLWKKDRGFQPKASETNRYGSLYQDWIKQIEKS